MTWFKTVLGKPVSRQYGWIIVLLLAGFVMHGGTALMRVETFLPYPRLLDFSGFYTAAWAVRLGLNPYDLSPEWVTELLFSQRIPFSPPPIYEPVIWPWLLQPFTYFSFPTAAWFWLGVNLLLLFGSIWGMAQLMHIDNRLGMLALALLIVTFGPVVLDLSLGQVSVFLLAGTLLICKGLSEATVSADLGLLLGQGLTAGVKLYPIMWLAPLVLQRRRRSLPAAILGICLVFLLTFLVFPSANVDYWFRELPQWLTKDSGLVGASAGLDDQSLMAWMQRVSLPQQYLVPGLDATQRVAVTLAPSWHLDPRWVSIAGYGVLAILCTLVVVVLTGSRSRDAVGGFCLWVVFTLLAVPHVERYNHVLLLPAMAWLWGHAPRSRWVIALVYFLTGVSRLTHLWMVLLNPLPATVVSGSGVYATILLGVAIAVQIRRSSVEEMRAILPKNPRYDSLRS